MEETMAIRKFLMASLFGGAMLVGAQASEVTINVGHVTQTSHPFHTGAVMFKEAVEKATDGRVEIKLFPARQLGDDKQLLEGTRLGTIDAAVISSAIFGGSTPLMDALQLPFLITDYKMLAQAFQTKQAQALLDGLDAIGLKGLAFYEGGQRHFLSNARLVEKLDDFKGQKTRVVPAKLHLDIWKAIGASPTPVAYGEIYTSLQTGVLDATEINVTSIAAEKLYEVAKNLTLTGHYFFPGVLVINPKKLATLSEKDQAAIIKAAHDTMGPQVAAAEQQDEDARAVIQEKGVKIAKFQDLKAMRAALASIYTTYEAKDSRVADFANAVRKLAGE